MEASLDLLTPSRRQLPIILVFDFIHEHAHNNSHATHVGGDRGGITDLIDTIKKTKLPIICIANDKYNQVCVCVCVRACVCYL